MGNFRFKQFEIEQDRCAMKVGTDGVLLGAWAQGGRRILDIGSGTGLISLMMAQRFPEAEVESFSAVVALMVKYGPSTLTRGSPTRRALVWRPSTV